MNMCIILITNPGYYILIRQLIDVVSMIHTLVRLLDFKKLYDERCIKFILEKTVCKNGEINNI